MFFDILLHLGTFVSVCVVYRQDILAIILETIAYIKGIGHPVPGKPKRYPAARLLLMMFLASLPLLVIPPIKDRIETLYYSTVFIGIAFLLTGTILFLSGRMKNGHKNERNMSVGNALVVGVAQAMATVPGLSRSGATISAGMAVGLDREFAARFSFLISLPAILGANMLSLIDAVKDGIDTSLMPMYLVGTLVAMVSGYFSVSFVRKVCRAGNFGRFAYYCWAAGAVTIILSIIF